MQKRNKVQVTIGFHPQIHGKLSKFAEEHQITINEIVRECVKNALPKLIERYRKREKRRTIF